MLEFLSNNGILYTIMEFFHILLKERELALKKHQGIGIRMDSELPHLVALEDDLLSTGILLYHLKVFPTYLSIDFVAFVIFCD